MKEKTRKTGNAFSIEKLQFENYSEGIDFITLSFGRKLNIKIGEYFLANSHIDTINANLWITCLGSDAEIFSIVQSSTPLGKGYTFSVVFNNVPIPVFQYINTNENTRERFHTYGKVTFYGSYFRLIDLGFFSKIFIKEINLVLKNAFFSRIDYRFDFFDTRKRKVPNYFEIFLKIRKDKKVRVYSKTGNEIESFDIGVKKYQTIFIRYYNKLIELKKNLKGTFLYGDIIKKYKTFHRLEYEFGQKYCGAYTFGEIELLKEKIYKTSGKPTKFSGYMYKPQIVLDLVDEVVKNRYIHTFQVMSKNLLDNGINPYQLIDLINEENKFKN